MTTEVAISRTSLSLTPLILDSTYSNAGIWLAPDGLGRPTEVFARNYATARDWDGAVQTDARLEHSSIPLSVYLSGASTAGVEARYNTLSRALHQFSFTLTVTVDDTSRVYAADCADLTPGPYTFGMVANFLQLVAISIPVYPIPS